MNSERQTANVILEIGCEEIPARFMAGFLADLKQKAEQSLQANRLAYSGVRTLGTCRRLVLYIENIAPKQEDISLEIKGPPADIAFKDGKPTPAAIGFARSSGVELSSLSIKTFGPKDYVFAHSFKKGEGAQKVLAQILPQIITSLYLPLSMRWGGLDFKFVRPIHWVLALYGKKIIKFELAGIKSSAFSAGHRYFKNTKLKVQKAELESFKALLLKAGVMLDQEERKEKIRKDIKKGLAGVLIEEDLLEEVNYLVEYPSVLSAKFNPKYLLLPPEVLITSMKKNQKYFPSLSAGRLESKFAVVTDGAAKKFHRNIREGNERVISARLEDARFFFEEDRKIPLKSRVSDLGKIAFFEKLGNMEQKTERIRRLADLIAKRIKLNSVKLKNADRAAQLSKADLSTQMVFEFPELQGVMGGEYARLSGEEEEVAVGILEHYLPRHAGDRLPASIIGAVVSLADKFDTLVGCFGSGYQPSGSADPYGLRRAVLGIVSIIQDKKLSLSLDEIIEFSHKLYGPILEKEGSCKDFEKISRSIMDFISARLKNILADRGIRHDIIDAVLFSFNDVRDVLLRAEALSKAVGQPWFDGIRQSGDRVARIGKKGRQIKEHDLEDPSEKQLYNEYMKINWEVEEKINHNNYAEAIHGLSALTAPVTVFFDKVLVMHEDERLKSNRLALLGSLSDLYLKIADFTKL